VLQAAAACFRHQSNWRRFLKPLPLIGYVDGLFLPFHEALDNYRFAEGWEDGEASVGVKEATRVFKLRGVPV